MAYIKIYGSELLASTLWASDWRVKNTFITMLAMCDRDGKVMASVPGVAHAAYMSVEDTRYAMDILGEPDPESRSQEKEGRRIEKIDGGWRVINYGKYRDRRDGGKRREDVKQAVKRHRMRKKKDVEQSTVVEAAETGE